MTTRTPGLLASLLVASAAFTQLPVAQAAGKPTAAQQATTAQVEALSAEAAERYRAGDFRAALARFREALALYDTPTIQYNIGRCHEALGEFPAALAAYEATARHPDTDPAVRVQARGRADALNVALAPNQKPAVATAVATAPPQANGSAARPQAMAADASAQTETTQAPTEGKSRVGAYVGGFLGIAALATGGALYGIGDSDASAKDATNGDKIGGERQKDTGIVLMAAGGGVLIASILAAVLMDTSPDQNAVHVGFTPTANGGGFAALGGTF